jgi:threonylcarbamoyladenosine tRNA methylthiotransferase MtaB
MRVFLTNLGCKLNQAENDRLARDFLAAGHRLAASLADADLHVVNSCTVTAAAARASRKAARAGARVADRPAALRTVLTGCYATASPEEAASLAGVDLVVANPDKEGLVRRFLQTLDEPPALPAAAAPRTPPDAPASPLPDGHTRAFLKVEDGCDMGCSFCIIPHTRGRQRSRPPAELVEEVRALVAGGYREIVVTGVQISAYRARTAAGAAGRGQPGAAAGGELRLAGLVRALLDALPPLNQGAPAPRPSPAPRLRLPAARLRLSSIAPWQLDDELLALWSDPRLCRHLHLSLQSGSTATLRRMRRPYTASGFGRLVARVRAAVPGMAVTTDVIVGFPGETAAEFEESLATVAALGFAKVHVFPFSPRPGTTAAALPDAVAAPEQRRRMERMLAVAEGAAAAFHAVHLGSRATVLWQRPKDGHGEGLTDNYIRVWSPQAAASWNRFAEVELEAVGAGGMLGRVIL